jgi:phenylalanyl-tRNA synthetase beta subunit
MKVSRAWLQNYFAEPLPDMEVIADALTFHSCEIEEATADMLDVKVLPDRAAYALSHRGIALEIAAALNLKLSYDPLTDALPEFPVASDLSVTVDEAYVVRHMGAIIRGVKVSDSPAWLVEMLQAAGQRSINNIVDATNSVMLNIGQPLHAFDLAKISKNGDITSIAIRAAKEGEQVTVLTGETYTLSADMFVVADATSGEALDIAGLKGGLSSGVTRETTDLFISVGTYDATRIRKMSQKLKLWTDASLRYQNKLSPELVPYGMRDIAKLITELAGGKLAGVVDVYPFPQETASVSVSRTQIEQRLGASYTDEEIQGVFNRLKLPFVQDGETYTVTASFERRDIVIPEDLIEEVGRLVGYERVIPVPLSEVEGTPDQSVFAGGECIKDFLTERGFTEISTQSFAQTGDILLANPLDKGKPWLRASLIANMEDALARAVHVAPKVFGPTPDVRLFELGTIFTTSDELTSLIIGRRVVSGKVTPGPFKQVIDDLEEAFSIVPIVQTDEYAEFRLAKEQLQAFGANYVPRSASQGMYTPYSTYPFALRDVAVWVPVGVEESMVASSIAGAAGEYLARLDLFDTFQKGERTSYAFRLVFEAPDRTLTDTDLDQAMEAVSAALVSSGFEVR